MKVFGVFLQKCVLGLSSKNNFQHVKSILDTKKIIAKEKRLEWRRFHPIPPRKSQVMSKIGFLEVKCMFSFEDQTFWYA